MSDDDARPRLSILDRAQWWALDYVYAAIRQLAWLAPPWQIGVRSEPPAWRRGSDALPEVILLPGVYEHWTFLHPMGDALNAAGYRIRVVHGLGNNTRPVRGTAEKLARALARNPPPAAGRVLVAHSKGGLIGKQLLVTSGAAAAAAREAWKGGDPAAAAAHAGPPIAAGPIKDEPLGVIGLVAVCAPFHGSRLAALLMLDPSIRALLPSNETIVSLGSDTSINGRIVSIFGRFDPHIPDGSALDGATNVQVHGTGHFRVLGDAATHAAVIDGIAHLSAHVAKSENS